MNERIRVMMVVRMKHGSRLAMIRRGQSSTRHMRSLYCGRTSAQVAETQEAEAQQAARYMHRAWLGHKSPAL